MRRILVALDRTAASSVVLSRAVNLARETGAKLRVMRAVPLPPLADAAEASLRELERSVPAAMRDGLVIELGPAAQAICRAAKAYDADVVVLGAHRGGVVRRPIGRTAARVVNDIDRPVFLVRSPANASGAVDAATAPAKTEESEAARFRGHDRHPILEASTLAGAATGAIAGVIGGVPGAVAGSMIGTALGMLAGEALDEAATSARDRKLDEDTFIDRRARRASEILRGDHELLEELYSDLLAAYHAGDWSDVRAQWEVFEPALRAHMESEERDVLPAFRAVDAQEADALVADHAELRGRLSTLGVLIDLHAVPSRDAEELVARLRAHAVRESALLYPWLDKTDVQAVRLRASSAPLAELNRGGSRS